MSSTRNKLIQLLAVHKDTYISGQTLSDELNISRSAIWKHMNELKKDGYVIEGKSNRGYRIISSPDKISENTISWGLETEWLGRKIIHKESVATTQRIAHEMALDGAKHGTVVIANEQTEGKGRINRTFHSKKDDGIWMSIILRPNILPYQAPQLTLLTATVLASVFDQYAKIKPQIKWPNDVLIQGKKISGILTEMQAEQDQVLYVIVGIGININQEIHDFPEEVRDKVTSLKLESNQKWDLVPLIQKMLHIFEEKYHYFIENGFAHVKHDWENYGFRIHERLQITTSHNTWSGIFLGVAEDGALMAELDSGEIKKVYSGEISWF